MAKAILHCIKPKDSSKKRILSLNENERLRIGRCHKSESPNSRNALFSLHKPLVSYKHAQLFFSNKQFYLVDISTNGTFINDNFIEKGRPIAILTGDVIKLGKDKIRNIDNLPTVEFYFEFFWDGRDDHHFLSKVEEFDFFNVYADHPDYSLNIEALYRATLDRFEVLQVLNSFGDIEFNKKNNIDAIIQNIKEKNGFTIYNLITRQTKSIEEEYFLRRTDYASHFILRIACCRNFPLRKWFIKQELKLMFIKWHYINKIEKEKVLTKNQFIFEQVSDDELKSNLDALIEGFRESNIIYYKVPFNEASLLLKKRNAIINNGSVFVPLNDMIAPIINKVESNLDKALTHIKKKLHIIWEDKRIISIIKFVENNVHFDRYSFSQSNAKVLPGNIDKLSKESFPLCMNILHQALIQNQHLRNGGRFQYSLFLKGIGLSLPNALLFWRNQFTKKMNVAEFIKNYTYHIKHVYGAVGKMADYPPQSCLDIMKAIPGPLEYHGCPYKILDEDRIKAVLRLNNLNQEGHNEWSTEGREGYHVIGKLFCWNILDNRGEINQVWDIMDKGMAQKACSKYFEITHGISAISATKHPNLYYEASRKIKLSKVAEPGQPPETSSNANQTNQVGCICTNKYLEW